MCVLYDKFKYKRHGSDCVGCLVMRNDWKETVCVCVCVCGKKSAYIVFNNDVGRPCVTHCHADVTVGRHNAQPPDQLCPGRRLRY